MKFQFTDTFKIKLFITYLNKTGTTVGSTKPDKDACVGMNKLESPSTMCDGCTPSPDDACTRGCARGRPTRNASRVIAIVDALSIALQLRKTVTQEHQLSRRRDAAQTTTRLLIHGSHCVGRAGGTRGFGNEQGSKRVASRASDKKTESSCIATQAVERYRLSALRPARHEKGHGRPKLQTRGTWFFDANGRNSNRDKEQKGRRVREHRGLECTEQKRVLTATAHRIATKTATADKNVYQGR
ncbi:hypothetical protein QTP88_022462 [Uroleucon formosanum]